MKVCFEYELNRQTMFTGRVEILLYISTRINHDCSSSLLVSHQVRRVRQTLQIKLFKDHE